MGITEDENGMWGGSIVQDKDGVRFIMSHNGVEFFQGTGEITPKGDWPIALTVTMSEAADTLRQEGVFAGTDLMEMRTYDSPPPLTTIGSRANRFISSIFGSVGRSQ